MHVRLPPQMFTYSATPDCFPFLRCEGMTSDQSQTDLFTCTMVLHCDTVSIPFSDAQTYSTPFHAQRCLNCGHTFFIKDSHKRLSSHYRYVCITEGYMETLHMKKMADLVAVGNTTLLTFELSF